MYGYTPQTPEPDPGSWGEILTVIRLVFIEIAKPIGFLVLILTLIMSSMILLFSHSLLAVLPLSILGGIAWWVIRRDQQNIRDAEEGLPPSWK